MRAAVITFPGSNCDRDLAVAFRDICQASVKRVWHGDTELPESDVIGIPGGFSYGDYLRCGAIGARSSIMASVASAARRGVPVIGICNGFQILCEAGLLPGALIRNKNLRFVCREVRLKAATTGSPFTSKLEPGSDLVLPVAHHDGNYVVDERNLDLLESADRIAFRYIDNPNGSVHDIAGVLNADGNVLGLMPHPERAIDPFHGGTDGKAIFAGILAHCLEASSG